MKKKLFPVIAGFLTAYSFRASIGVPLQQFWYETKLDWVIGSIYELLGYYDFLFLFFWFVCAIFYVYMREVDTKGVAMKVLSGFFAVLIPIGLSIRDLSDPFLCFGSVVNSVKTLLMIVGFFLFFVYALNFLRELIQKKNFLTNNTNFFTQKPFLKSFLILFGFYGLVDLISYPGNLNADTIGQIYQIYGIFPYSEHHPLMSTFLVGGFVKLGDGLFHSQAVGLFLYVLFQTALLAGALSFSMYALSKKKLSGKVLWTVLLIYLFTPVYSNITSTAIKDVPFMGFLIVYVVLMTLLIDNKELIKKPGYFIALIATETLAMLFRNNGRYIIIITGLVFFIVWFKDYDVKGKIMSLLGFFLAAAVLSTVINSTVSSLIGAEKASKADIFSLPFQMLGAYYMEYPDDFSASETQAIEKILGPLDKSLSRYNPALADQIKTKFVVDCTNSEIIDFAGVWLKLFFRHPSSYIKGFLVHTYGWYDPVVSAEIRYETLDDDYLTPTGIFETIDKGLVFIYRFLNRISILGALENVGTAVWVYLFLFVLQKEGPMKKYRLMGVYMLTNLLICFAAPAFLEHTRYGFPILMTVPFLFSYSLSEEKETNK